MASKKSQGSGLMPDFKVSQFFGTNTSIKNLDDLTPGTSPDSLNWITGATPTPDGKGYFGDHIELRRGYALLGQTRQTGNGFVSGIGVGTLANGNQVPFYSAGRSIRYYNSVTGDTAEVGSNALPVAAENDDVAIVPYQNLAGSYVLVSSQNSSLYKIVVADPASIIDFVSNNFRGKINVNQGRVFLWQRKGLTTGVDPTNVYLSWIDSSLITSDPPFVPVGPTAGTSTDGVTKTFAGTLPVGTVQESIFNVQIAGPITTLKNVSAATTALDPQITATAHGLVLGDLVSFYGNTGSWTVLNNAIVQVLEIVDADHFTIVFDTSGLGSYPGGATVSKQEQFIDDKNGNMSSQYGGTGTINYVTGAFSVTFNTAPVTGATLSYFYYEEEANDNSFFDFTFDNPRTTGQGDFFPQQGYGNIENVLGISNIFFCFHQFGTFQLQIPADDTESSNLLYRSNVGIPNWRAAYATGDGIIYLDTLNESFPRMRVLTPDYAVSNTNPAIVPQSISDALDLSGFTFQYGVVYEWGDYYILNCQGQTNGVADVANDEMYVYNKKTGYYDRLDYRARCHANYLGALLAGSSIDPNVYVLFSGFDDDGFNINNYWKSAPSFLGAPGLKRFNRLVVKGLIQPSQSIDIYLNYDNGSFVKVATVGGQSQYVQTGSPIEVGGPTVGSNIVGGGGVLNAFPYEAEFIIGSDYFNRAAIMFEGTGIGYLSVDEYTFKDIRYKTRHILPVQTQVQ